MPRSAPLTKNDVSVIFDEKLRPFLERQESHESKIQTNTQTLFGPKGDDGLVADMVRVKGFQKTILYIFTVLTAICATLTALMMMVHNGIIKLG